MNRAFSTREKVLLVILALLLIGVGYFKLLLEPINESIDNYTQLASSEQDAMLQGTAQLVQHKMFEAAGTVDIPEGLPHQLLHFALFFRHFVSNHAIFHRFHSFLLLPIAAPSA